MLSLATNSFLTPSSLELALANLALSATEQDIAVALVTAATLIQTAIASNQDAESFMQAIESVDGTIAAGHLSAVLARAVNFQLQEDGSTLGLWLMPVLIKEQAELPGVIDLSTDRLQVLRTAADFSRQMGFQGNANGWVSVLPTLIAATVICQADIGALIRFPLDARKVIQGLTKTLTLDVDSSIKPNGGLYFLPFVVKHPADTRIAVPLANEQVIFRITKWVTERLTSEAVVQVFDQPEPFSDAIATGERYFRKLDFNQVISDVCLEMGVMPSGMSVLLAGYAARNSGHIQEALLGISVVSRLTGVVLATISMPVAGDLDDFIADAKAAMILNGVGRVQVASELINTFACQHCGEIQLAIPGVGFGGLDSAPSPCLH